MGPIIASIGIALAGLYLTTSENNSLIGALGAMLMFLGVTFLVTNVYLRRAGRRR